MTTYKIWDGGMLIAEFATREDAVRILSAHGLSNMSAEDLVDRANPWDCPTLFAGFTVEAV